MQRPEFEIRLFADRAEANAGPGADVAEYVWRYQGKFPGGGYAEAVAWLRERLEGPATGRVIRFRAASSAEKRRLGLLVHLPAQVQVTTYRVQLLPGVRS